MVTRRKLAAWVFCMTALAATQGSARAESITLNEALERAEKNNPDVAIGAADVDIARGQVVGASRTPYNPELSVQAGPAFAGGGTFLDFEVSLGQTFELGGKRARRTQGARARNEAASLRLGWTKTLVTLRVRRAFYLAIVARDRLGAAQEGEAVAAEVATASSERLRVGAGTQLELNVAAASLGRARALRISAERAYGQARAELAAAMGSAVGAAPEPSGNLPEFGAPSLSESELAAGALAARPDLKAAQQDRSAAEADLALAESLSVPDAAVGVSYGHSGVERSNTVLFGVTFALPFWNRNQGGRASTQAQVRRASIVEESSRREVERFTRAAHANYLLAREAVLGFDRDVIDKLGDNLKLARDSYASGKIGLLEFNLARRELVETRFAYLDALAELVEARYALELAAGGAIE